MGNIRADLESMKERFSDEVFLSNKGLSNEVGIHVFCYDPQDEMIVRDYIEKLIPEEDWTEQVQIIGWLYQYYNTEPKAKVFDGLKKNIKISAENIPAATQLFTPDWIVRYMVENSLGRLWADGHEDFDKSAWKYYLDEAQQEKQVQAELEKLREQAKNLKPEEIKFLDPCMGSGHILVYAFDVLMQIYTSCGWSEREAAKSILQHNLYGLDIDRRAFQLAYFAVMMKARQYNRRILTSGVQPNLAHFQGISKAYVNGDFLDGSLKKFAEQFENADTYGSLMTVNAPENIDEELADFTGNLGIESEQIEQMMRIYSILSQKYDVVVTNPPYMGGSGMNGMLSDFVKKNFADYKSDLFSAFMVRCMQLVKQSGYLGFLTPYVWMFIQSYEKLRQNIYSLRTIETLIQFEYSAFEEATVPICTFVLKNSRVRKNGCYFRLTDFRGGMEVQRHKALEAIADHKCGFYYESNSENLSKIPGCPVAYWVSENVFCCFDDGLKFSDFANPKQGIKTADKDRFLRFWHEVSFSRTSLAVGNVEKWFPCNKGGSFRKWYGNNEYVVNWENNGYEICNFKDENGKLKSRPQNLPYMLKEGLTYTNISSSSFGVRYSPTGYIYDAAGSLIYVKKDKLYYMLGLLASNMVLTFTKILSPTMSFEVGQIASIPVLYKPNLEIDRLVHNSIELSKTDWDSYETSWDFERNPLI